MAGKGDRMRRVNGPRYRDNYDVIDWSTLKKAKYSEEGVAQKQHTEDVERAIRPDLEPQSLHSK
jgi:hypothetical protein